MVPWKRRVEFSVKLKWKTNPGPYQENLTKNWPGDLPYAPREKMVERLDEGIPKT